MRSRPVYGARQETQKVVYFSFAVANVASDANSRTSCSSRHHKAVEELIVDGQNWSKLKSCEYFFFFFGRKTKNKARSSFVLTIKTVGLESYLCGLCVLSL